MASLSAMNPILDGNAGMPGNPSPEQCLDQLIDRSDKVTRKVKSMHAKSMYQRTIHSKRLQDFVEKAIEKLKELYTSGVQDMDTTLNSRHAQLTQLQNKAADRIHELRKLKGTSFSVSDLEDAQKETDFAEKLVESVNIYELIISPKLVTVCDVLQSERKPIYVRTSSLYPSDIELLLLPEIRTTKNAKVLSVLALPLRYDPQLPQLLVASIEKVIPSDLAATSKTKSEKVHGIVTTTANHSGGDINIAFTLNTFEPISAGAMFIISVDVYGRAVTNSPMKIRVLPGLDSVQVVGDTPVVPEEDSEPESEAGAKAPVAVKPPAAYSEMPSFADPPTACEEVPIVNPPSQYADICPSPPIGNGTSETTAPREPVADYFRKEMFQTPDVVPTPGIPPISRFRGVGRGSVFRTGFADPPVGGCGFAAPTAEIGGVGFLHPDLNRSSPPLHTPEHVPPTAPVHNTSNTNSLFKDFSQVRLPKTKSTVETMISAEGKASGRVEAFQVLDPEPKTSSVASSRGLFADDLDTSRGFRSRTTTLESECPNYGMSDTNHRGIYESYRPDLSNILSKGPKNISGEIIMKFGIEKTQGPVESCFLFPIGCTKDEITGDFIICDTGHSVVKIFDSMAHIKHISDAQFRRPAAVVAFHNSMYAVRDDQCIQVFSKEGQYLRTMGDHCSGRCYGLTTDKHGNLVTLDLGRRNGPAYLLSFDPSSGNLVSRDEYTAHLGNSKSKCRFIHCYNDMIYVVDLGASMVYGTSLDGTNVFQFGGYGNQPGSFNEPSGVSADANGNVFIGDSRNDRVLIFTPNGDYFGEVKFDYKIKRPSAIHLTADGNLMVMNYVQHYVSLFKLHRQIK